MNTRNDIIKKALDLKPSERFLVIEALTESLDKSDDYIKNVWLEEVQNRVKEFRLGKRKGISVEEVLKEEL